MVDFQKPPNSGVYYSLWGDKWNTEYARNALLHFIHQQELECEFLEWLENQTIDFKCNGDYWYQSGCGNRVETEGHYCEDCDQILTDNKGRWPGQESR